MRFVNHLVTVLSLVNLSLLGFLLFRDWRFRTWLYEWELYSGPNTLSDQALSLQLGLLQATVVGVGLGLSGVGVLGFRNIQEAAVKAAENKVAVVAKDELDTLIDLALEELDDRDQSASDPESSQDLDTPASIAVRIRQSRNQS